MDEISLWQDTPLIIEAECNIFYPVKSIAKNRDCGFSCNFSN